MASQLQLDQLSDVMTCILHDSDFFTESSELGEKTGDTNDDKESAESLAKAYGHFHFLSIPLSALLAGKDYVASMSSVDQGSYDVKGFDAFVLSKRLDARNFVAHTHQLRFPRTISRRSRPEKR